MNEKETIRREGRIIGGALIAGISAGLTIATVLTNTFHVSLPNPIWQMVMLAVGTGLIISGCTKSTNAETTERNKTIFAVVAFAILAVVIIWKFVKK